MPLILSLCLNRMYHPNRLSCSLHMPPKSKDEAPKPKKKVELPKEPCGCGVNTFRPPPKGKKLSPPVEHNPGCSFQRASCNRYPHLPKCSACEEGCSYCCGINPWCLYCAENKCKFQFRRDVLAAHGIQAAPPTSQPNAASAPSTAPRSA
jgi:hypothetical protein